MVKLKLEGIASEKPGDVPMKYVFPKDFEWGTNSKRFGLIHHDFQTLKRTWKDSAYFYKEVIKNNGVVETIK